MQAAPTRHNFCAACAMPVEDAAVCWDGEVYCSLECARAAPPGARVLLIARSPETAAPIREALTAAGHRVASGADAVPALRDAVHSGVDIVLVEADAEPLDGLAVAAILAADASTAALPVVILARHDDLHLRRRAREVGAAGLLVQPHPASLAGAVGRWARGRGQRATPSLTVN